VPFEKIDAALAAGRARFPMPVAVRNPLEKTNRMAEAVLLAPVATGLGAVVAAAGTAWRLGWRRDPPAPGPGRGDGPPRRKP
jgi:hypothetical protein